MLRQSESYAELIFQFHLTVDIENQQSTTLFTYNMIMIMCIKVERNRLDESPYVNSFTIPISLNTLKLLYIVATLIFRN